MKILRAMILASSSVAILGVLGCDVVVSDRADRVENEQIYVEPDAQPTYVIVTEAPPAPRNTARRPSAPTREAVWIDGYYSWNGRQYVWESGRWVVPPRSNVVWIAPRYDRDQRGYRYTPGYWQPRDRDITRDQQPRPQQAPPLPPQERR